ncbi:MFS transport protein AraJ [Salmonella bongori]|nr:MFS transport protein AraJ [Salmonella bongori]
MALWGVLTELARDAGISIPAAGHMISFYACGVVLGAPIMALFSNRFSLKSILLFLVTLCVIGNAMFTLSSSYLMLAIGRLVSGFPHGAFFGVGAIVLSKDYSPRESHRRRRGYGFRDDGSESGWYPVRYLPESRI